MPIKPKKNIMLILVMVLFLFVLATPVLSSEQDVDLDDIKNSSDHPLISRFPGSYIRFYESKNFDEITIPLSELEDIAQINNELQKDDLSLYGQITKTFYVTTKEHSTVEIFKNYESTLKENNFEILAVQSGGVEESFRRDIYSGVDFKTSPETTFEGLNHNKEDAQYLLAKLDKKEGSVYISLFIARHGFYGGKLSDGMPAVFQIIVEEKEMDFDLIDVDPDYEKTDFKKQQKPDFPEGTPIEDVSDSRDHPLISRFPGSYIRFYENAGYDEFEIPLSELKEPIFFDNYKKYAEQNMVVEGELIRHFYIVSDKHSTLEIFRNYEYALKENGFELIAVQDGMVEEGFKNELYSGVDFKSSPETSFEGVEHNKEGARFLAAKLDRAQGDVYIAIFVARHGFYGGSLSDGQPAVFQVIVEETDLKTDLIDVESALRDLESKGKVEIYGIYFDVDSAKIKEKSEPTVKKIAELLNDNPSLKLYVVGHTDITGGLDYNIDLSEKRAESIVNKLVNDYNISKNRLIPYGVGPLAPKATNETEEGRARNRRVELVKFN